MKIVVARLRDSRERRLEDRLTKLVQPQYDSIVNDVVPFGRRKDVEHGLNRCDGSQVDKQIDRVDRRPSVSWATFATQVLVQENFDERRDRRVAQSSELFAEFTRQPFAGSTKDSNRLVRGAAGGDLSRHDEPLARRTLETSSLPDMVPDMACAYASPPRKGAKGHGSRHSGRRSRRLTKRNLRLLFVTSDGVKLHKK